MTSTLYAHNPILVYVPDNDLPGNRLKRMREERGLSRRAAAKLSEGGITHAHIGNLEDDPAAWAKASIGVLRGLSRAYNLSIERLLTTVNGTDVPPKPNIFTDQAHLEGDVALGSIDIPEYDMIQAGPGGRGGGVIGTVPYKPAAGGEYVAYRISGDSMSPRIRDGYTVVVKVRDYASPGNMIVCWTPDDGMMCKYLKEIRPDGTHVLTSFNAEYQPIWALEIKIYGLVVEIRENVTIVNGNHA